MRTNLTRLLAGTAVAATAVLTIAGTASATTAPPKAPTTLSIVLAKNTITVGEADTVGGTLASNGTALPGRTIQLDRWNLKTKHWSPFEEKKTGAKGGVAFRVWPATTTSYRLVFPGSLNYKYTHSGTVTAVVVKVPTVLSISQSPGTSTPKKTDDTISGQLTTAKGKDLAGQWVWLASVANGKTHFLRAFKTGKFGKVSFKVSPPATTTYELAYVGPSPVFAHSVSSTVTDTVS
jgi:hypothetical protein